MKSLPGSLKTRFQSSSYYVLLRMRDEDVDWSGKEGRKTEVASQRLDASDAAKSAVFTGTFPLKPQANEHKHTSPPTSQRTQLNHKN